MIHQQEQELLAAFRRMSKVRQEHTLRWIANFAPPKEQAPRLTLIVNKERKQQ
jgi:hypothetical protein